VSDAEKATLAETSTALNTVPATAMTESATMRIFTMILLLAVIALGTDAIVYNGTYSQAAENLIR
jgi:hypothetical protein